MIRQLGKHLINKIAAGEVVERPLSVVKELTENAIDAGAGVITVEIKDGGLTYIRITDNGSGIPADEIMLAFAQHATSKITDIDDLSRIGTLGFRGEALASIASVSYVEMLTKTAGALAGTRIEMHGGTLVARQELGCTEGTTIVVSNLFFNTPARLKFLKKPSVEAGYITDLMQRLVMGYPNLSFRYISNGREMITTSGNGDLKAVIYQIYGMEAARGLLPVLDDDFVSGYIGKPEISRSSRGGLNFFINGRYIKSELLQNSVEEVFKTRLPIGRFPLCVLYLSIPSHQVDVNVHPAKLEVRFSDEREVYGRVSEAVSKALSSADLVPAAAPATRTKKQQPAVKSDRLKIEHEKNPEHEKIKLKISLAERDPREPINSPVNRGHDFALIAQIFDTYWLAVSEGELFFIDQHAAHERVIYEELLRKLKNEETHAQPLLEPYKLNLNPRELETALIYKAVLADYGFELDEAGNLLTAPMMLNGNFAFFTQMLDKLEKGVEPDIQVREEVAMAACKAAVKAKDFLSQAEARGLINRMLTLDNPYSCPHGRPTMVKLTRREIERMFNRT